MSMTIKDVCIYQERVDQCYPPEFSFVPGETISVEESIEHLLVCTLGELGELANLLKKVRRGDFAYNDKKNDLTDELSDVFIYVIKIANAMEIDLEDAYIVKMKKNETRFADLKQDKVSHDISAENKMNFSPSTTLKNKDSKVIVREISKMVDQNISSCPEIIQIFTENGVRLSFPLDNSRQVMTLVIYSIIESSTASNAFNPFGKELSDKKHKQLLSLLHIDSRDFSQAILHLQAFLNVLNN